MVWTRTILCWLLAEPGGNRQDGAEIDQKRRYAAEFGLQAAQAENQRCMASARAKATAAASAVVPAITDDEAEDFDWSLVSFIHTL